ncbi:hypothetical protein Plhal710r2_c011g0051231 [Plasmopara halstedii]
MRSRLCDPIFRRLNLCAAFPNFLDFLMMFVPILPALLLLDVSVSSASNSSIVQHEDPVVFDGHVNDSLPSANSSLTAAEGELESYDDSEQSNTDIDETDGEMRMFSFIVDRMASSHLSSLPKHEEGTEKYWSSILYTTLLQLKSNEVKSDQQAQLFRNLADVLAQNHEELKSIVRLAIANALTNPAKTEQTQAQLLKLQTKLSTVFESLMEQTNQKSLQVFFETGLDSVLLSYASKLSRGESRLLDQNSLADDVARLLTVKREDGNLITWLGTYRTSRTSHELVSTYSTDYMDGFIRGLLYRPRVRKLAYRLKTMITPILSKLLEHYDNPPQAFLLNQCLQYAAYTRFSFIEHEAKSSEFMLPHLSASLKELMKDSEFDVYDYLKAELEKIPKENFRQFAAFNKFEWSKLD